MTEVVLGCLDMTNVTKYQNSEVKLIHYDQMSRVQLDLTRDWFSPPLQKFLLKTQELTKRITQLANELAELQYLLGEQKKKKMQLMETQGILNLKKEQREIEMAHVKRFKELTQQLRILINKESKAKEYYQEECQRLSKRLSVDEEERKKSLKDLMESEMKWTRELNEIEQIKQEIIPLLTEKQTYSEVVPFQLLGDKIDTAQKDIVKVSSLVESYSKLYDDWVCATLIIPSKILQNHLQRADSLDDVETFLRKQLDEVDNQIMVLSKQIETKQHYLDLINPIQVEQKFYPSTFCSIFEQGFMASNLHNDFLKKLKKIHLKSKDAVVSLKNISDELLEVYIKIYDADTGLVHKLLDILKEVFPDENVTLEVDDKDKQTGKISVTTSNTSAERIQYFKSNLEKKYLDLFVKEADKERMRQLLEITQYLDFIVNLQINSESLKETILSEDDFFFQHKILVQLIDNLEDQEKAELFLSVAELVWKENIYEKNRGLFSKDPIIICQVIDDDRKGQLVKTYTNLEERERNLIFSLKKRTENELLTSWQLHLKDERIQELERQVEALRREAHGVELAKDVYLLQPQ